MLPISRKPSEAFERASHFVRIPGILRVSSRAQCTARTGPSKPRKIARQAVTQKLVHDTVVREHRRGKLAEKLVEDLLHLLRAIEGLAELA